MENNFSPYQSAAISTTSRAVVVTACPGSGKTRTIAGRVEALLNAGAARSKICVLTFTNAVADEINSRLEFHCDVCGDKGYLIDDGWLHAPRKQPEQVPCQKCEEHRVNKRLGYCGTIHGLMLRTVQTHYAKLGFASRPTVVDEDQADEVAAETFAEMRVKGVSLKDFTDALHGAGMQRVYLGEASSKMGLLLNAYWNRMTENAMIDFNMILEVGINCLMKVDESLRQFDHLLVDELQDASAADFAVYRNLLSSGRVKTLFMVGDANQSIYKFRGGSVTEFIAATEGDGFAPGDFESFTLPVSYRCPSRICEAANALIVHNGQRTGLMTHVTRGGEVTVVQHSDEAAEVLAIVQAIRGRQTVASEPLESFAVLLRTNALADRYRRAISGYGVAVATAERAKQPEGWRQVKAFVAYLAAPDNDALALRWFAMSEGKEQASVRRLSAIATLKSVNEDGEQRAPVETRAALEAALTSVPVLLAGSVDRVLGLADELAEFDMGELLLAMARDEEPEKVDDAGVTVTTMHRAKGREWPHVFLPASEQGIVPTQRSLRALVRDGDVEALEEERRLYYVAVTRALRTVTISHCKARKPSMPEWANPEPATVSVFAQEATK